MLLLSFVVVITIGTFLLRLPQATEAHYIPLVDALFTATSATCVTGLVVGDTGADFTLFGQLVIIGLIQVGGLGIMTFSSVFLLLLGQGVSLRSHAVMRDTLAQISGVRLSTLVKSVVLATLVAEGLGTMLLYVCFVRDFSPLRALYYAGFHAVSAFCNAGFGLFVGSFEGYRGDVAVNLVITTLILAGGIGFFVLAELRAYLTSRKGRVTRKRLSLHTKLVLSVTLLCVVAGSLGIFFLERGNLLAPLSWHAKILSCYFQSVTARTAGFSTLNCGLLTNSSLFLLMILMFVGASPGSTGGGIKTTTAGVLAAMAWARFRGKQRIHLFGRSVPQAGVSRAISIVTASFLVVVILTFCLLTTELALASHAETRGSFVEILFEVFSAVGTVGLTTGLTESLTVAGRVLITILMFVGRLGPLTVAIAVGPGEGKDVFAYPEENVMLG